jgi:hypothetical protein
MGLSTILGGLLNGGIKDIIDAVHLDPAKKAELEGHMADLQAQAEQADKDLEAKLNDIAGQNIRADTSSNDSFVRRARPYFLYVITTCIAMNLILPMFNHLIGGSVQPLDFSSYNDLFRDAFLGYTFARTVEKFKGKA